MFIGPIIVVYILRYIEEEKASYWKVGKIVAIYAASKIISAILTQLVFFYSF